MTKNVAASIHQRLLNHARANELPFNQVLQYFALERFLYRLGCSPFRQQFVLKGALMLTAWQSPYARPTRDIDLLGRTDNTVEHIVSTVQEICQQSAPEDGLVFDANSVTGESITEAANYAGVRVRFAAYLGTARVPMQVDIGFGDPVVPAPSPVRLPTVLDLPTSELLGYSRESMVAEKVQVMVYLAEVNNSVITRTCRRVSLASWQRPDKIRDQIVRCLKSIGQRAESWRLEEWPCGPQGWSQSGLKRGRGETEKRRRRKTEDRKQQYN